MTQRPSSAFSALGWFLMAGGGLATIASAAMLVFALYWTHTHPGAETRSLGKLPPFIQALFRHPAIVPTIFLAMSLLALVAGVGLVLGRRFGGTFALAFCLTVSAWCCVVGLPAVWYPVTSPVGFGAAIMRAGRAVVALALTGFSAVVVAFTVWLFRALKVSHPR